MFSYPHQFFKCLFFIGVFLVFLGGYAQRPVRFLEKLDHKKYHWGFYLGAKHYGYKLNYKDELKYAESIVSIPNANGFNVGLVGGWRINPYIALRVEPGFTVAQARITFMNPMLNKGTKSKPVFPQNEIDINELRVPFYLKLNGSRYGNVRPFVLLGFAYGYNFSSNQTSEEDNAAGVFRSSAHNLSYEFGVGVDIYTPYFKFSPAIKAFYSINNQLVQDIKPGSPYTSFVDQIKSRGIFMTIYFE